MLVGTLMTSGCGSSASTLSRSAAATTRAAGAPAASSTRSTRSARSRTSTGGGAPTTTSTAPSPQQPFGTPGETLSYRTAAPDIAEIIRVQGQKFEVSLNDRPLIIASDRLYVCKPHVTGGHLVGGRTCSVFPVSEAPRFAEIFADQYLRPLSSHGFAARLFRHTSSSTRTVGGFLSNCLSGPAIGGGAGTICAAERGGFLTYFRAGREQDILQAEQNVVAPGSFRLPKSSFIR